MAKKRKVFKQEKLTDICPVRKKRDRFDGLSEDEVLAKKLPDHLAYDLDIIIVCVISHRLCVSLLYRTVQKWLTRRPVRGRIKGFGGSGP